tara:strand:- start:435 stop:791 length:357 start_codon:yes stop_codon:yes gene_type:complete
LIHDSFGDYQAKSDSSLIHQLIIIHKRKESKELVLVILLNAYSRIDHGDLQKGLSLLFNDSNFYFNFTLLGEFKSVALESEEYLHETSSICDDHGRMIAEIEAVLDVDISSEKLYFLI